MRQLRQRHRPVSYLAEVDRTDVSASGVGVQMFYERASGNLNLPRQSALEAGHSWRERVDETVPCGFCSIGRSPCSRLMGQAGIQANFARYGRFSLGRTRRLNPFNIQRSISSRIPRPREQRPVPEPGHVFQLGRRNPPAANW